MIRANRKTKMLLVKSGQSRNGAGNCSMTVRGAICLVAISAGLLTGCGGAPRSKYYQLTVPNGVAEARASDTPVKLLIGSLSASHLYREDGIVYSRGSEELGTYQYQRWVEPPTDMLGEVLV